MITPAVLALLVSVSPGKCLFDTEISCIYDANGGPTHLHVAVAYKGAAPIRVTKDTYQTPCHVAEMPPEWRPRAKLTGPVRNIAGWNSANLEPGDRFTRLIPLDYKYEYTAVPGRYSINVNLVLRIVDINGTMICDIYSKHKIGVDVPAHVVAHR